MQKYKNAIIIDIFDYIGFIMLNKPKFNPFVFIMDDAPLSTLPKQAMPDKQNSFWSTDEIDETLQVIDESVKSLAVKTLLTQMVLDNRL